MQKKNLSTTILLSSGLLVAATHANIFIGALPAKDEAAYTKALPAYISEAVGRPGANPKVPKLTLNANGYILLAPLVYNWAPDGFLGRGFPPWWAAGDKAGGVQAFVSQTYEYIKAGLMDRGYTPMVPQALQKNDDTGLMKKLGDSPLSIRGMAANGARLDSWVYLSDPVGEWKESDFKKINSEYAALNSAVYININTSWRYDSHSKVNGEAMINYDVYSTPIVKVCQGASNCVTARVSDGNPVRAILPVPAEKCDSEDQRKANNAFAVETIARYYSAVVLGFFENVTNKPIPKEEKKLASDEKTDPATAEKK